MQVQNFTIIIALCIVYVSLACQLINGNTIGGDADRIKKAVDEVEHGHQVPKIFDYGKYVEKFRKSYGPLETLYKAKLFFGRTLRIFQHNVLFIQNKVNYFLIQNVFTDMTPAELKESHTNKQPELAPVAEASKNPDLPASSLASVRKLTGDKSDGFSQASLDDLGKNAKYDSSTQKVKPVLNFMDYENVSDLKLVLRELKDMPEFAARVAEIIDLKGQSDEMLPSKGGKRLEELEGEAIRQRQEGIQYKPVVKSNNDNYEPQETISYGSMEDTWKTMGKNYANFLMQDPDLEGFLEPYPEHPMASKGLDEDAEKKNKAAGEGSKSAFSSFFDSVKGVANFLLGDDLEEEYQDEDDQRKKAEEEQQSKDPLEAQLATIKANGANQAAKFNVDWRQTGCISSIQNQKSCDSCYAFTVLGLMEYFYCRQTKELTTFSAQYVVDCGQKVDLNGCRGSRIANVGQFIKRYGLELDSKYPYNAKENECPYNFNDTEQELKSGYLRPTITHWQNFQEMVAWYKWLRKSPLIVGINMPADFLAYGGGVHDGLDCVNDMTHAMLLIGSGIQDGREFWLLKNSYSDSWGEEGYFKLSKSAPLRCFNSAIVARAKFATPSQ